MRQTQVTLPEFIFFHENHRFSLCLSPIASLPDRSKWRQHPRRYCGQNLRVVTDCFLSLMIQRSQLRPPTRTSWSKCKPCSLCPVRSPALQSAWARWNSHCHRTLSYGEVDDRNALHSRTLRSRTFTFSSIFRIPYSMRCRFYPLPVPSFTIQHPSHAVFPSRLQSIHPSSIPGLSNL